MAALLFIPGIALVLFALWDAFEVIVLPRRVQRNMRPARYFFIGAWRAWAFFAGRVKGGAINETMLSVFGPLALLLLFALWAGAIVVGYALIHIAASHVSSGGHAFSIETALYFSGTTFFTLGLGDVAPRGALDRTTAVLEAANGLGFLALVISYLPIFYQSFSRREASISLLDARAGSPPTAGALLYRFRDEHALPFIPMLAEWERWAADLLESHLSYAVLMFFRSQHERQSWVAALTAMLDTCAVIMVRGNPQDAYAANLTFAMARHAAVDLSAVFERLPEAPSEDRLPQSQFAQLRAMTSRHPRLSDADADGRELAGLRITYEPYVAALARYLRMPLPPWVPGEGAVDAWQTSPTERAAAGAADPVTHPGDRP